jgi:carboxylesterase
MGSLLRNGEPFLLPGGEVGCLLIHGFTATPQEMRWLGEHLSNQGYTTLGVRLFAHATQPRDLIRAHWEDWLACVEDGYQLLLQSCTTIFVMGLSLGGALSLLLASRHSLAGVIAMSTPYQLPVGPRLYRLLPLLRPLSFFLPTLRKGPPNWRSPDAASARVHYNVYALRPIPELDNLFKRMRSVLPSLNIPILLMHSRADNFVPPNHLEAIYAQIGSRDKSLFWVDDSNHVITCDQERDKVFAAASEFVQRICESRK